ncbi:hypothetical protein JY456_02600 [Stenotrophomonas maltophilia]|nr:hypothetical protein [Stenotrophomonas maltophilia]
MNDLILSGAVAQENVIARGPRSFSIVRTGPLRPAGDALSHVRLMLDASRSGNASATYEIFLATLDCKRLYSGGITHTAPDDGIALRLEECESLLSEPSLMDIDWLTDAAEQGSVEAMNLYATNPDYSIPGGTRNYFRNPESIQKWKDKSISFLNKSASIGSQDAMLNLSTAYSAGILFEENPVAELAFAMAANRVHPIPGWHDAYIALRLSLSPMQIQQSESMANQIYQTCCKDHN